MDLEVEACIPLDEPTADAGFITWFNVAMFEGNEDEGEERVKLGQGLLAVVHAGSCDVWEACDADSTDLEAIGVVYYTADGCIREDLAEGKGQDVMYLYEVKVNEGAPPGIDYAVVRRLADTIGTGCALVTFIAESDEEAKHWQRMGFERTETDVEGTFLHLNLAHNNPRIARDDATGGFKVVPYLSPERRNTHH